MVDLCDQNVALMEKRLADFEESLKQLDGNLSQLLETFDSAIIREEMKQELISAKNLSASKKEGQDGQNQISPRTSIRLSKLLTEAQVVDLRRQGKWKDMLAKIQKGEKLSEDLLKSRGRKGIPDSVRGTAWPILAKAKLQIPPEFKGECQLWIKGLLLTPLSLYERNCIFKDISRTLPDHKMFTEELGSGQKALFGVLKCISLLNPEVGYVQGMGFLTAVMMTYTTAEESLCMMMSLFKNYQLLSIFQPGLPGLEECIFVHNALLKKYMPKLFNRLAEIGFVPQMYCVHWFMTVFAVYFPMDLVVRIWDIYLIEGRKTVFRIGLAIMKIHEDQLMDLTFDQCFDLFKEYKVKANIDELFKVAFNFTFSKSLVNDLMQQYQKTKKVKT